VRRHGPATRRGRVLPALLTLALLASTPSAHGQEIRFTARAEAVHERRLADFLRRGEHHTWTVDTVLAAGDTVSGDLLVLRSAARIAGVVTGDVFVVAGDLFLRPGSRILGDVVVLGGGYYASGLAAVDGAMAYRPNDLYSVLARDYGWAIYPAWETPRAVELPGLHGLSFPTYQRVDGWTLEWGARLRAVGWGWQPSLELSGRYLTERSELQGTVGQYWHPSGSVRFGFEYERATRTNETWVRGGVSNTFSFLFVGDDFRNYFDADRAAFVIGGIEGQPWRPTLSVQWEKARSLEAEERFVLFGEDEPIPNPAVDEGETVSLIAGLHARRRGPGTRLEASVRAEWADSSVAGDFSFLLGEGRAFLLLPGLGTHEVELFALARGDLWGSLPRQRWTAFGGRATLPTFELLGFHGPRALYGQATYLVPVHALRVTMIGPPKLLLRAATGTAWGPGQDPELALNLVAGVRWSVLEAGVAADPGTSGWDPKVYGVFRFPGDL
jgi:hypothetical protein